MLKVDLGINSGCPQSVKQVSNEQKGILIFPSGGIKATEVHAES
jgi:hypothetical protein